MSQAKPKQTAQAVIIRPTMRLVRPFYTLSFLLAALIYGISNNRSDAEWVMWLMVIPVLLFLWTVVRHVKQRFTTLTVQGNKLRYETGMTSRSTRSLELSRIQDVRVDQTLFQRLLGIGTITIETAGETGRLSMANVDQPHDVSDFLLDSSRK